MGVDKWFIVMKHITATTVLLACFFAVGHSAINWYDGKVWYSKSQFERTYGQGNWDRCWYHNYGMGNFVDFDDCLIRNCKRYGNGVKMEVATDWNPDMQWGKWCRPEEPRGSGMMVGGPPQGTYYQKKKCFERRSDCSYNGVELGRKSQTLKRFTQR